MLFFLGTGFPLFLLQEGGPGELACALSPQSCTLGKPNVQVSTSKETVGDPFLSLLSPSKIGRFSLLGSVGVHIHCMESERLNVSFPCASLSPLIVLRHNCIRCKDSVYLHVYFPYAALSSLLVLLHNHIHYTDIVCLHVYFPYVALTDLFVLQHNHNQYKDIGRLYLYFSQVALIFC